MFKMPDKGGKEGKTAVSGPNRNTARTYREEVKKQYINLKKMLRAGTNGNMTPFQQEFTECCKLWKDIQALQGEYKKAEKIQALYYPSGKILRQIERLCALAEHMAEEKDGDSETMVRQIFNGCINYIWLDYQAMAEIIREADINTGNAGSFMDFLQEIACKNERLACLAGDYAICAALFEQKQSGGVVDYKSLKRNMEEHLRYACHRSGAQKYGLTGVKEELRLRKEKTLFEIRSSREIYEALSEILTRDTIEQLQMRNVPPDKLAACYTAFSKELEEKVRNRFPENN